MIQVEALLFYLCEKSKAFFLALKKRRDSEAILLFHPIIAN